MNDNDINSSTTFTFISSFGPQMDIIDKDKSTIIESSKEKLKSVSGTRLTLTSQRNQPINIFGVFIYSDEGIIINTDNSKIYISSIYRKSTNEGSNAIKIVRENSDRKANQARNYEALKTKGSRWNNWNINSQYCSHTDADNSGIGGGSVWEYNFEKKVNISTIEIFGRIDCCPERMTGMRIEIFNDMLSTTQPIWVSYFGTQNANSHKVFTIDY